MVSPLLLRNIKVGIYPTPTEIRVGLYAIGPNDLNDLTLPPIKKK